MPLWHERAMLAVWLWLAFDAAAWLLVECGLELVMVDRRMDAFLRLCVCVCALMMMGVITYYVRTVRVYLFRPAFTSVDIG